MALYAFDGTWNSASLDDNVEQENETNVANFCEAYADENKWSDVGGGNGNVGLSYIARRWMLRKAKAAGLPINDAAITACDQKINPDASLHPPKDFVPNEYRGFLKGDRFHYTVRERPTTRIPPRTRERNPGG